MRSYETLAVMVLALSTASPAVSAPVLESQQHARASIGPAASSSFLKDALKSVGTSVALSVGGEALKHFLGGGNNTRRDIESPLSALRFDGFPLPISNNGDSNSSPTTPGDGSPASLDRRAPGLEEANEGVGSLDHSRREPLSFSGLAKTGGGLLASWLASEAAGHLLNQTRREPQPSSLSDAVNFLTTLGKGGNTVQSLEQFIELRGLAELD
jgi:hypothetical protein